MKPRIFTAFLMSMIFLSNGFSQSQKTLAERLGYPADARLLIIHADDMGLSHSTNMAVIKAFEAGGVTSGSIMVPCPWFPEIADYVKHHPGLDVGIHTTLTAEWKFYKWDGVLPSPQIPSLIDTNGYFYHEVAPFAQHARADGVEKELRAQIDRAIAFGIDPTHIDNHMGTILARPDLFETALKLAMEYRLPILIPSQMIKMYAPQFLEKIPPYFTMVDNLQMLNAWPKDNNWTEAYRQMVQSMKPGLNELIVHLSYDNEEMKAIAIDHPDFGSTWRQNDLNLVLSPEFQKILKDNHITLVTWKQIRDLMRKEMDQQNNR